jgi:hypothetical protein
MGTGGLEKKHMSSPRVYSGISNIAHVFYIDKWLRRDKDYLPMSNAD